MLVIGIHSLKSSHPGPRGLPGYVQESEDPKPRTWGLPELSLDFGQCWLGFLGHTSLCPALGGWFYPYYYPVHKGLGKEELWWNWNGLMSFWGLWGAPGAWSFMSQCRRNSGRGEVVDMKWLTRIGHLWGLQAGRLGVLYPGNLVGCSLIIKGKMGRRKKNFFVFLF